MVGDHARQWLESHPTVVASLFTLTVVVTAGVLQGGASVYIGPQ